MKSVNFAILLLAIRNYRGERTINGIIHLLKGKRSTQVIQDGFLFHSLHLFGVFKKVDTPLIFSNVEQLKTENFLFENNNYFHITDEGEKLLTLLLDQYPFINWLNGWKYDDLVKPFWNRLLLFIQSLSYTSIGQANFRPIIQDYVTFQWVRAHFPKNKDDRKRYAKQMYEELFTVLNKLQEPLANIFVAKLTGVNKFGLTNEQISEQFSLDKQTVDMMLLATLHYMLNEIQSNKTHFPLLSLFTHDINHALPLTQSAKRTYELWQKGFTMKEIANIRQLKINTIEDHFIEIAIADANFPIDDFVSNSLQQEIFRIVQKLKTTKLRPIKDELNEDVTYFQIRLVLTNLGGNSRELKG